jgi:predicted CoA-binding protein
MKVAVLGASDQPRRSAYAAIQRLRTEGYEVIGVNPRLPDLGEIPVVRTLGELPSDVHTLTVYLAPERSTQLADELERLSVQRVIFNPGSEHPELERRLAARRVQVVAACTLVLLATGRFEAA